MRPEFDHDEEFLIAYYRQYQKTAGERGVLRGVTVVAAGAAFFALGYFKDDITWSVIGFGLVCCCALRDLFLGARYGAILARVIGKYEDALRAAEKKAAGEDRGAANGSEAIRSGEIPPSSEGSPSC